jgi:hypothetical protein
VDDGSENESEGEVETSVQSFTDTANCEKAGDAFKEKDGTIGWELGKRKRVTISEFKGKKYVNIREYYEKDGKVAPARKTDCRCCQGRKESF